MLVEKFGIVCLICKNFADSPGLRVFCKRMQLSTCFNFCKYIDDCNPLFWLSFSVYLGRR